jgi:hypothetical protein
MAAEGLSEVVDLEGRQPPLLMMPDLAVFFKALNLNVHDDLAKNNHGAILKVSFFLNKISSTNEPFLIVNSRKLS